MQALKTGNFLDVQKSVDNVDNVLLSDGCKQFIYTDYSRRNPPVKRQNRVNATNYGPENEKVPDHLCAKKRLDTKERKYDKKQQNRDYILY